MIECYIWINAVITLLIAVIIWYIFDINYGFHIWNHNLSRLMADYSYWVIFSMNVARLNEFTFLNSFRLANIERYYLHLLHIYIYIWLCVSQNGAAFYRMFGFEYTKEYNDGMIIMFQNKNDALCAATIYRTDSTLAPSQWETSLQSNSHWLGANLEPSWLSGVPDSFDRNKILSGGDLSHYQVPHCVRVFFHFVWFVFIHHNFQFHFELCTYCNILDICLS